MADKIYEVLDGQKMTGIHRVYKAGDQFKESELAGDLDMALNGSDVHKIAPKIKEVKGTSKKTTTKASK